MAQFKVIPPETGTEKSLWCGRTARGLRIPMKAPWRLRPALSLHSLSECSQCRDERLLQSVREVPHSYSFSLPEQSLQSPSIICKSGCKSSACISFLFLFFFKRKKVDESLILKNCAIQQTNFLFCLLSLLIYRIQLNIIEAGSWFAVWAIWRRISFFVIMPRRRLKRINRKDLLN